MNRFRTSFPLPLVAEICADASDTAAPDCTSPRQACVPGQPSLPAVTTAGRVEPCNSVRMPEVNAQKLAFWVQSPRNTKLVEQMLMAADGSPRQLAILLRTHYLKATKGLQ